ncbi:helix-turn-helix domain-containing protein [Curtobacterium flaccumfaciens]|uniref:helix-turn-helix domain-containing protein n=1 Tax=Curtobacterium flaccumfaciens TaxID=2035 RepID=UPI001BDEE1BC|nr:helix-turn-helix domain-containing protein [Curtobacterium flaccumfaciens]MBT1633776.1 helix-turn-helix domain-containing protein [Curtobacterium flaccumfaciens pv. oortii]MCX2845580.1 helix-turn-helix domain-containing protein [Curtobacterium flaccumfaciens pv. oortii]
MEQIITPGAHKAVLLAIASFYNEKKLCAWPAYETLALMSGNSRATVARAVNTLVEQELIDVELFVHDKGGNGSNRYYLPLYNPKSRAPMVRPKRPTFEG